MKAISYKFDKLVMFIMCLITSQRTVFGTPVTHEISSIGISTPVFLIAILIAAAAIVVRDTLVFIMVSALVAISRAASTIGNANPLIENPY